MAKFITGTLLCFTFRRRLGWHRFLLWSKACTLMWWNTSSPPVLTSILWWRQMEQTPLLLASQNRHSVVVETLTFASCSVNIPVTNGSTVNLRVTLPYSKDTLVLRPWFKLSHEWGETYQCYDTVQAYWSLQPRFLPPGCHGAFRRRTRTVVNIHVNILDQMFVPFTKNSIQRIWGLDDVTYSV